MIIINAHDVCLNFGTDVILDKISFGINEGERIGVVGVNGAGKSMLFKIIAGIITPTEGEIFIAREKRIGFLEQNAAINSKRTLMGEMLEIFAHLTAAEGRMADLTERLNNKSYSENEHMKNAKEYTLLEESYKRDGGYEYKSRIKSTLCGIGFPEERHYDSVETLSGGQKTRLALAKILLSDPDILMLDEPTNHLDISTVEWLEDYLKGFRKTLLVVSHDRYFLDKVTGNTLEIENKEAKLYTCSYTEYVKRKEEDRKADLKHYELQQKEIARMEAFIENQRRWNRERNIIAAESRMKAIERMDKIEKPKAAPEKVAFKFRDAKKEMFSERLLTVKGLSKAYSENKLFTDLCFELKSRDRLFIYGKNGVGKSTLLKILSGKISADSGSFEYVKGIKIGYYDQEHQGLDHNNTVIDELWNTYPEKNQSEIRNALARFLFCADDVFKKVEVLSGGEKARLTFAKLMLEEANLLILDEPTNHLDIPSREMLEEALSEYGGTLLCVSHDRYFIKKLANRIVELKNGGAYFDFKGGYDSYIDYVNKVKDKKEARADEALEKESDYERQKREKSERRKNEKALINTEKRISDTETKIKQLQKEIEDNSTDYQKLSELYKMTEETEAELERLYEAYDGLLASN